MNRFHSIRWAPRQSWSQSQWRAFSQISRVSKGEDCIRIEWKSGDHSQYPYIWLRDHCRCNKCFHPTTLQRQVDTLSIPHDILPASVRSNGDSVLVDWEENGEVHHSQYPSDIFQKPETTTPKPVYWDSQSVRALPTKISFHELQGTVGMKKMMDMLDAYGFVLVNNVEKSLKGTEELATKISYVRSTIYGTMWTLIPNMEMEDTAYTRMELRPHTDGCYLQDPPGIQIFHILEHDGTGGETTLVDGFKVVKELQEKEPAAWEFFAKTPIDFQYLDPSHHLYQRRTIFDLDENNEPIRFHYNNDDRAPVLLPPNQLKTLYSSLRKLLTLIRSPKFIFKFRLIPGECLITDNWRVLHGRTSFTGHRKLVGCYLNHEDHISKGIILRKNFL